MVSSVTLPTTRGSGAGAVEYERAAGQLVDGRYQLLRPLGRGGMGEVWVARDGVLKTEVALKFLSRELDEELAEHLRQRFRFEAQVSALLAQATEDIARVHDVGNDGGSPYLVMELIAGRSLERVIDEQGAMTPALFLPIFTRLCGALEVAHAHGIVHRDIKPANVLVGASHRGGMRVVLTDFGIAKGGLGHLPLDRPKDTREGFMVGSPDYMAPEQFRGGSSSDRRIDLWTMGVLAYEALTGRMPFSGRTMPEMIVAITSGDYPAPTTLVHALPARVDGWFVRALAKDPAQRFGSPREMADSLRACFEPVAAAAPAPSPPARGRGSGSTKWLALAALVLVISAAAVAVLRTSDGDGVAAAPELEAQVAAATLTAAELVMPPSAPVAASAPAVVAPTEQGAPSTQADAPAASAVPTSRAGAPGAPRTPRSPARPVDPNPNEPSAVF
jgi:serine/threonine-protein kinase